MCKKKICDHVRRFKQEAKTKSKCSNLQDSNWQCQIATYTSEVSMGNPGWTPCTPCRCHPPKECLSCLEWIQNQGISTKKQSQIFWPVPKDRNSTRQHQLQVLPVPGTPASHFIISEKRKCKGMLVRPSYSSRDPACWVKHHLHSPVEPSPDEVGLA